MLNVVCPTCEKSFEVALNWAGKTAKCKTCQTKIRIPDADSGARVSTRPAKVLTAAELLKALPERVEPVRTALGYQLALAFVAGVLVLLPVLYLGLTLLVAYGVYWHFAHSEWFLQAGQNIRGKGVILVVLAYLAPGIIGTILIIFMFKPLFRWRSSRGKPFALSRETEPLLHAYVDRLCDSLGAPRPVRIDIRGDVNASASFSSGWSLFTNRLVLTIGLPIVAGLSLRQFTGVLAHEFGHFSQYFAMRMSYVIETVNDWFRRVVEERDSWDHTLEAWSSQMDIRFGWVLYLARFFVWLVRKILTGFRYVGLFFSRRLARQMEYDADQYEIRIAGSEEFARTFERMAVLGLAEHLAEHEATQFLREGKPIDDFARFVTYKASELKRDEIAPLLDRVRNAPAPWISTHPSDGERIARAAAHPVAGAVTLEAEAQRLFKNFNELSREYTCGLYTRNDGEEIRPEELASVDELIAVQKHRQAQWQSALRWVADQPAALHRWATSKIDVASKSDEELTDLIVSRRNTVLQATAGYATASETWSRLWQAKRTLQEYRLLIALGQRLDPKTFPSEIRPPLKTMDHVNDTGKQLNDQLVAVEAQMDVLNVACAERLAAAIELALRATPPLGATREEMTHLQNVMEHLQKAHEWIFELGIRHAQLEFLFQQWATGRRREACQEILGKIQEATYKELVDIWSMLAQVPYPFESTIEYDHLARALLPSVEDEHNPYEVYQATGGFRTSFRTLWQRVLGRLTEVGEAAEAALNLPPLVSLEVAPEPGT